MTAKILIIEDEEDIIEGLTFILKDEGYEVFSYTSGIDALTDIKTCNPDIILLDLMLPDMNGIKICKNLKNNFATAHIPILILTSKSQEQEIVDGIKAGCNDYITKPFSEKILLAKIESQLKFSNQYKQNSNIMKFKDLIVKCDNYEVFIGDKLINLTPTEFKVLCCLMQKAGIILNREQIIDYIDPQYEKAMNIKSIDILITRIRKKLNDYSKYIESVYGVGYRFKKD